ncbi:MAG: DNA recombination protein RmuC, partial [Saprospiraceae bacterium]|nr:DNA recombination protein RmuC [Saprospiraceae bacterium]
MDYSSLMFFIVLVIILAHFCVYLYRDRLRSEQPLLLEFANWKQQQSHLLGELKHDISDNRRELYGQLRDSRNDLDDRLVKFNQHQIEIFDLLNRQVKDLVDSNEKRFNLLHTDTTQALEKIRLQVSDRLEHIRVDNQQQLEKMRATVDDKLHQTLEERLGRSFKLVSDHLEKVQKGLGEMQSLAAGVGDLKKVLSNVKTRGILGEIQLLNIIEEIMTPDQYDLNA